MPIIGIIISFFMGSSLLRNLAIYAIGASVLFLAGLYEGNKWTAAYEQAQYEKARAAEAAHQAQVEQEFRIKEQDLIKREQALTDQVNEIQNDAIKNPGNSTDCIPASGLRRLNEIR